MFKNVFQKIELGIYISVVAGCSVKRQDSPRLSLNWNENFINSAPKCVQGSLNSTR